MTAAVTPCVSVVIPTRNRSRRLVAAVRSALAQRDVSLEVIVIDDGSVDETSEAIARLAQDRVNLIRNEHPLGESGARNRGIEVAKGEWIAFLDDDDLWAPDKLRRQLHALQAAGRQWAYAGHVIVDARLRIVSGAPPPSPEQVVQAIGRHNSVPGGASNVIASAKVLARAGGFDPGLKRTADWDMWLRLARHGPPAWVPSPLVAICVHAGNMSRDMSLLFDELPILAQRHGIAIDCARHYRWAAWSALGDGEKWRAVRYYARAVMAGDLRSLGRAMWVLLAGSRAVAHTADRVDGWTRQARTWLDQLPPAGSDG